MLCYPGNQGYSLQEVTKTESDVAVKNAVILLGCRLVLDGNAGSCGAGSELIGSHRSPPSHRALPLLSFLPRMVTLP